MRKNHCSISRCSTTLWQRQQVPPSACSLARTVWHEGHQFTGALARYAMSRSSIFRKNHWFQR